MAGYFQIGETKVRPGSYFNIGKNGDNAADSIDGVTAVIFRADFGPLGRAVEIGINDNYEEIFGNGGTTDAIRQAFNGGAQTVIACRLGEGGANSSIVLKDENGEDAVKISAKHPGTKEFTVTVKEKITNPAVKQYVVYSGTKEIETLEFHAGENEAQALCDALASDNYFTAELVMERENCVLENVLQRKMEGGTDPVIKTEDYSNAFAVAEPYMFNTICVDTENTSVHLLLAAFVERIFGNGSLAQAIIAENSRIDLDERIIRAASYNNEKIVYVLNPKAETIDGTLDGYQTAARIAGMIAAASSKESLTHKVISDFTDLSEMLTNSEIINAQKHGCIVLARNTKRQIWIDSAINTLTDLPDDKDEGWKKIRRVKTRFELLRRCNEATDNLIGIVDNDSDGRKTIIGKLNAVGLDMISEGKLTSFSVTESDSYTADVDSCWFCIDVVDKDSAEHIYTFFKFQFSTNIG